MRNFVDHRGYGCASVERFVRWISKTSWVFLYRYEASSCMECNGTHCAHESRRVKKRNVGCAAFK